MEESARRIIEFCDGVGSAEEFVSSTQRMDACIRNFQVLGEASSKIPVPIQKEIPKIPWRQVKGMRNFLVHEYFGISPSIMWGAIRKDLPTLIEQVRLANQRFAQPVHPWRICPPGETYVRSSHVKGHIREGSPVVAHMRRDFCREMPGSGKDVLTVGELQDIAEIFFKDLVPPDKIDRMKFGSAARKIDPLIQGWVKYWNEVLKPSFPLDPDTVRALVGSESSFIESEGRGKRGGPKGLLQLVPLTLKSLQGHKNELGDHLFEFSGDEIFDANLNISAGIRWLHQKQKFATRRLKREATWEEAVEEFKGYLHKRVRNPKVKQDGMTRFRELLRALGADASLK